MVRQSRGLGQYNIHFVHLHTHWFKNTQTIMRSTSSSLIFVLSILSGIRNERRVIFDARSLRTGNRISFCTEIAQHWSQKSHANAAVYNRCCVRLRLRSFGALRISLPSWRRKGAKTSLAKEQSAELTDRQPHWGILVQRADWRLFDS